eukprot:m.49261 g.49261  ORF g.49261 m.49261 type:complete len:296 (+) comp7099_c0_seq1:75-962(+)
MSDKKGAEKKDEGPKMSRGEQCSDWLHHKATGPDDEDTYCGTRNAQKWKEILLFYFLFYGSLVIFWVICYQGMFANIPARIGGSGPTLSNIKEFGNTLVINNNGDYSNIAGDNGAYTFAGTAGTQAFRNFRSRLSNADYTALQNQIQTDAGQTGTQFFWNNCTAGSDPGCTAASNYGTFGPVYLVTYQNRKWNRPQRGSTCAISCTGTATFASGATNTVTIPANNFWQLSFQSGTWTQGNANLDCTEFQNQPGYRAFTAVSTQGYTSPPVAYRLTCTVQNIDENPTGAVTTTYSQ